MSSKISALGSLAGSGVAQTTDLLAIVDTSVTTTKSILVSELSIAQNVVGTEQATTSGSSKDFTIPAWATRISMMIKGVSQDSTPRNIDVQIGDTIGVSATGYSGAMLDSGGTVYPYSTSYRIGVVGATNIMEGVCELTRMNTSNTWLCRSLWATSEGANGAQRGLGRKTLDDALTTVRLSVDSATFDAGAVNVLYS